MGHINAQGRARSGSAFLMRGLGGGQNGRLTEIRNEIVIFLDPRA